MALYGGSCVLLCLLVLFTSSSAGLRVRSEFNQRGVRGSIVFSQDDPTSSTLISVNLTGLSLHPDTHFQWHVHQYPFPLNGLPNPCGPGVTGGHYDPLGANFNSSYTELCAHNRDYCEVGDLSGKFGLFNITESDQVVVSFEDPSLSLHGVYSIIGRSIVIHLSNGARLVCANIEYPPDTPTAQDDILYSPFRSNFAGAIYFRGHTNANTSSVYSDLLRISGNANSEGHNWHVHESPVDVNGTDCDITGPHYNPLNANVTSNDYATLCNSTMQENCEIGDLSNKGAPFDVENSVVKQFYTDHTLPLAGDMLYIVNRSIVIHAENRGAPRISCANITRYDPLEAIVTFNDVRITGDIRFSQLSPFDPTIVTVNLQGLRGIAGGYHVHVTPVPPEGDQRCDLALGHWNPTNVVYNDSVTRQLTSDEYEIGDLSGKFGGLGRRTEISETYSDPNVPLFGRFGILGRSVVIHREDDGSRITCENIRLVRPVIRVETLVNTSSLRGRIVFSQPADDPYADTTITVELEVLQVINVITPTPSPTPSRMISSTVGQVTPSLTRVFSPTPVTSQTPVASQTPVTSQTVSSASQSMSVGMNSTSVFQTVSPSQTTQPIPMFNSSLEMGSGDSTIDMLPFGPTSDISTAVMTTTARLTAAPSPTPMNMGRRKRHSRGKRQAPPPQMVGFDWSVRAVEGDLPTDCNFLPVFEPVQSNPSLCSPDAPLACPMGDLTGKHGPLSLPSEPGLFTAVFTDSALPLSGPRSPFTASQAAVLVQQIGGDSTGGAAACSVAMVIEGVPSTTGPTSPMPETTQPPPPAGNDAAVIGAVVGGVVGAILLVTVVIVIVLLVVCCMRRRSEYKVSKQSTLELGTVRPSKPILGVPHYRALHDYSPQNNDDLKLSRGDWVTLIETPLGGGWWKGSVEGGGEGWFPRTYVEYVNVEAEKKRQEEENFLLAASAIMAASTSFSAQHPSLTQTQNRHQTLPAKSRRAFSFSKKKEEKIDLETVQRSQTFSRKMDIDSTPRAPRKLDRPYLADDDNKEATVIVNEGGEAVANGDNHPETPVSQRKVELYVNEAAMDSSPVLPRASEQVHESATEQDTDKYIAKYDFSGSTDIELELTKGAMVTIVEKSDGGWWKGMCEGRVGWFPETYVRPAPVETAPLMSAPVSANQPASMEETMKTGEDLEATEYRAIFPYQSDTEGDLEFGEGETVWVYWAQDNGWWYGAVGSVQGWFPGSFVEAVIDVPTPNETLDRKESRSSFRKMWSLRRKSRDKTKDSDKTELTGAEAGNDEEKLPPSGAQAGSLEGQLQAALERRRSIGRERNLAVDEQVAKGQKRSEPQKSRAEMVADFVRRSFKKSKARGREEEKDEEEVVKNENVPEGAAAKQQAEAKTPPVAPSPKKRRDAKSRRVAPPPPPGATPSTPAKRQPEPLKEEPSPVTVEVATPTSSAPTEEEPSLKTEETKPLISKEESSPKTTVTRPPSSTPQAPQTSTAGGTAKTTPPVSTTQQNTKRPIAHPRKHRSAAALPQRRPPPLPPGATNAATPTTTPSSGQITTNTNAEETKAARTSEAPKASKPAQPPVPPRSSLRPRIQKVKRPISRMIPPPPNIPLPPPPTRKVGNAALPTSARETVKTKQATPPTSTKETVRTEQTAPTPLARKTAQTEQAAAPTTAPVKETVEPEQASADTTATNTQEKPSKPAIAPKPSVAPKPAHLRRISAPAMTAASESPQPALKSPQPTSEPGKSPKPKPLPPARSSSLASRPTPTQRKIVSTSVLPKIEDRREEVDSPPLITKEELDEMNEKASRSAPPRRPPPPRPASVASNKTNKIEEPAQPQAAAAMPAGGKVLYSAPDAQPEEEKVGRTVKTKGSSLMRSLKKMVTRDSRKGSEKASKEDRGPKSPTQKVDSSQDGGPVPKPRPKVTETASPGQESPGSKPARRPPPRTPPTQQKKTSVPTRPPPPKADVDKTEPAQSPPPKTSTETKPEPARPPPPKTDTEPVKPEPARPPPPKANVEKTDPARPPPPKVNTEPTRPPPPKTEVEPEPARPPPLNARTEKTDPKPEVREVSADKAQPSLSVKPVPAPRQNSTSPENQSHDPEPPAHDERSGSSPDTNFYRATSEYKAQNDKELSFSKGDVLIIVKKGSDGFHFGMLDDGTTGLFPLSAVEPFFN